jgi:outer membrane protein OmpA-like peptidoglycan-associated protein
VAKRAEEATPPVPLWIITFSDMTTNLLTFFVLLLSMGHIRDDSLFDEGQRISRMFLESVKAGFGAQTATDFDFDKIKYTIDQPEQPQGVTRDAREEQRKRLFQTLQRSMQTQPSQLKGDRVEFSVASVRFLPGQAVLDDGSRQWLSRFCLNVRQNLDPATNMLYIVGLPDSGTAGAQAQMLAAHRSRVVATFLRQNLATPTAGRDSGATAGNATKWRVFWWGAGPGASWAGQDSPEPGQSQILIAAMKMSD